MNPAVNLEHDTLVRSYHNATSLESDEKPVDSLSIPESWATTDERLSFSRRRCLGSGQGAHKSENEQKIGLAKHVMLVERRKVLLGPLRTLDTSSGPCSLQHWIGRCLIGTGSAHVHVV